MSTNLRIGGATLLGVVIILGALYVENEKTKGAAMVGNIVSTAPERQYIDTTDSNSDGVEDWKDGITDKIFKSIETPTSTLALRASESYTPPTTFTGKFSEAFFTDYMEGKVGGTDIQDKDALINNAIKAIEENTKSKIYTSRDIIIIPDSMESLREYGNRIAEIIQRQKGNGENELFILKRAVETGDPKALDALVPITNAYTDVLRDTLLVPAPQSLVQNHIALLSAYEAVLTDVSAMGQVFSDPLYTMARVKRHEDDAMGLFYSLKNIATALVSKGIAYADDEPGAIIYTLDL